MEFDFDEEITSHLSRRIYISYFFIGAVFFLFLLRLWYLQVLKGDYFFDLSENNRLRIQEIAAPRGTIFDRNGKILADNIPSFDISVQHEGIKDWDKSLPLLGRILNLSREEIAEKVFKAKSAPPFRPIKLKVGVSPRELSLVEFYKLDLPNTVIEIFPNRNYRFGPEAGHILGYLGEVGEGELKLPEYANYHLGDFVGKSGLEKEYETRLRGRSGGQQIEVDATGRVKRVLSSTEPRSGENFYLTLDSDLQHVAENIFQNYIGALVAMDPNNGDILAFVSHPSFDPNSFSRGISAQSWRELRDNPYHPLINKGIQGLYPPGSVFKIITALAALEEKKITPDTTFFCNGHFPLGNQVYHCWRKGGHGTVDLYEALEQSCDVYFYQLGQRLGIDTIARYAQAFGLGRLTQISLPNEKEGLVPTRAWKKKKHHISWQRGETLSAAIGQSFTLVTPCQIAVMMSAVANGGKIFVPRIVERYTDQQGHLLEEIPPHCTARVPISPENLNIVREALRRVVQSPTGTGKIAQVRGIEIAGKTGTAQVVSLPFSKAGTNIPFRYRDHAWFTAFAPFQSPKIVVAVLVEHGGFGSSTAGPLARDIIAAYLKKGS